MMATGMNSHFDFNNKSFVIAGAGGIGTAIARKIDDCGGRIVLVDLNEETLKRAAQTLVSTPLCCSCDFSYVSDIENVVQYIVAENGPIDGLVYCAGIGDSRPVKLSNYDFMKRVMDINFFSYIEFVRQFTRRGNYNEGLCFVGISSVGAFLGNPAQTAYAASKAAMNGAIRCIAKELAPKGIRINNIAPGTTNTEMFRKAASAHGQEQGFTSRLERQYLGLCEPDDIANAAVFLLSDMSRMITGSCLGVDGGKLTS